MGLLQSGRKFLALPWATFFSFYPPHSCTHLMPCYSRVKCFNSRICTLETTLDFLLRPKCISSGTEWHEMAAVDLRPNLFSYRTRVNNCMSVLAVRILLELPPIMLLKPFLGRNNRQAKAVSPPTHRPFVQTDSGPPFGLSK